MRELVNTGTYSKNPLCYGLNPNLSIGSASGSQIYLTNGRGLTDWVSGLGANLYGWNQLDFVNYVSHLGLSGAGLSLPHILEYDVADLLASRLQETVPGWWDQSLESGSARQDRRRQRWPCGWPGR